MVQRYLQPQVERDLERKMVFVAGPRQVGKTTLALNLPEAAAGYLTGGAPRRAAIVLFDRRERVWGFDSHGRVRLGRYREIPIVLSDRREQVWGIPVGISDRRE